LDCGYCVPAGTPVLLVGGSWKAIEDVEVGDKLVGFEDESQSARGRRFVETNVTGLIRKRDRLVRFTTSKGSIESTPDHEWLVVTNGQKKVAAADVRVGDKLYWLSEPVVGDVTADPDYRAGWLAGFGLGDGSWNVGVSGKQDFFRVYSKDEFLLDRWDEYARTVAGVGMSRIAVTRRSGPQAGYRLWHNNVSAGDIGIPEAYKRMLAIMEQSPSSQNDTFARGWLAGMFDAEGTRRDLCITQKDESVAELILSCWLRFGYDAYKVWDGRAAWHIRVRGGVRACQRFASEFRPACEYKVSISGKYVTSAEKVTVEKVELLDGEHDVYDVTTGARTFIIGGYLAWECYQGSHMNNLIPKELTKVMPDLVLEKGMEWAVNWMAGAGDKPAPLRVNLYGGEPLMAWDRIKTWIPLWNKYFMEKRGREINWAITTNGTLLNDEKREFLDRYNVSMLMSLDGPKELHDKTRVHYDGRGSWDEINPEELVKWRPNKGFEIAWQLDPSVDFKPHHLDELMALGFTYINFNLNWLSEWSPEAQLRLQVFFRHVGRLGARGELKCNWVSKLEQALAVDTRMEQPCGTGLGMLALTPEGWLYPSQEMAYTAFEPGKPKDVQDYYRVGNVFKNPVIDAERLAVVSKIRLDDMIKPFDPVQQYQYDCNNCVAKTISISSCHCRLIGEDPADPAKRYNTPLGYCQSEVATVTGLMQGYAIERKLRTQKWIDERARTKVSPEPPKGQVNLLSLDSKLNKILEKMNGI